MSLHESAEAMDVIVLELNELCPRLMDEFINQGKLPNFQRLRDSSVAMVTDADEAPPRLEPWIQWATIHSGMKAEAHQVFDLGEGRKLKNTGVAKLLSDAGVPVGILGSMNTNYRKLNGFFVPDPWDIAGVAEPAALQPFYETVSRQVQNSSSEGGLTKKDLASFGWFMLRHGMRPATIFAGLEQLVNERKDHGVSWRRSMILEQLQFDLFRHLKRKYKTRFSTFFCNSTAHFQHYYWRNMEPNIFEIPPGEDDHPSLQSAIEEGYVRMDQLVGRFLEEYSQSRIVLLTALSQKPWTETTKCTFRPTDFEEFLQFAGVDPESIEVKPVMAEEFHLICKSPKQSRQIRQQIMQVEVDGQPAMKAREHEDGLFCGCVVNDFRARKSIVVHPTGGERPFDSMFHMVHSMRSGRHHPHGLFWVQGSEPRIVEEPVALVDVAPTLLSLYGLQAPEYMTGQPLELSDLALATA